MPKAKRFRHLDVSVRRWARELSASVEFANLRPVLVRPTSGAATGGSSENSVPTWTRRPDCADARGSGRVHGEVVIVVRWLRLVEGDLGGVGRRYVRARGRRKEGRDAQRHRPAGELGELRQHHQGLHGQVRNQGQLHRSLGQQRAGSDADPAEEGHLAGRRRARRGRQCSHSEHPAVRALRGCYLVVDPGWPEGPQRALRRRLRWLHVGWLQLRQVRHHHVAEPAAGQQVQELRRAQR
jgi:hypothetical protein